ncbi:MAG: type II secretion system protein, partial [Planctomycetes bacterium]|nr:type II secretion system protein [Planctomycetota bacterium]
FNPLPFRTRARGCSPRRGPQTLRRRAFTLIEMVGTTLILGITITGTVGAVHVITRAGSQAGEHSQQRAVAALAMNRMRREIGLAITVTSLTSSGIDFTHPDITGDNADDVIAYAWSGTSGDPLTRTLNNGTAQALIPECNSLVFKIETRDRVDSSPVVTETPEVLIASHDIYPVEYTYTTTSSALQSTSHAAMTFTPNYTDATSVRFTRAKLSLKKIDWWMTGTLSVEIHSVQAGTQNPADTVLEEVNTSIADLSTAYLWEEFYFDEVGLTVGVPFSLVAYTDQTSTYVRWESHLLTSGTFDDGVAYRESTDAGATWDDSGTLTQDVRFYVYGVFDVTSSPTVASGTLDLVHIHLESVEGDSVVILDGATECVNQPDLTGFAADALPTL